MKIIEWIISIALWVTGAIALVFFGWCIKGYCAKKGIKYAPVDKAEEAVLNATEKAFNKKG